MTQINFHPITLSDRAKIEGYTRGSAARSCDLSFVNIYCWQPLYRSEWAEVEEFLVIRFMIDGGEQAGYMQPIGRGGELDFSPIIPHLRADAQARGERLMIVGLTEQGREALERECAGEFAIYSDPSSEDYIYLRESLATLKGRRLQPKRNHINNFERRYPDAEYRPISRFDFESCLEVDCRWRSQQGDMECGDMSPERCAMIRAFDHFEELDLMGGALFVEGRMAAFTYGSMICSDTLSVHSEKALSQYEGCYPMINRAFARSLPEAVRYLNREEDMGIEGLRRAKLSYYPDHLQRKYSARILTPDERGCRELWHKVFGDEYSFIDEYLHNHHSAEQMMLERDEWDGVVSMLHLIPFDSEIGRVAYIYAVATHPDSRGRGCATRLIREALLRAEQEGYMAALLIPGEESLRGYYQRFGFEESAELSFSSYNNFDFGGDDNRSMICWTTAGRALVAMPPRELTRL